MHRQSCWALHHHSGAELGPWSGHVHKIPFRQAEAELLPWRITCSRSISSFLTVHRNWCDLNQPAWWPARQAWTHRSSYVQNHKMKCRWYKLWVHTLMDKGTTFKAPESNQHTGNVFQHRLCQGNKNWVFLKWYQENRGKKPWEIQRSFSRKVTEIFFPCIIFRSEKLNLLIVNSIMQLCPEGLAEEDSEEETSYLKDSNL